MSTGLLKTLEERLAAIDAERRNLVIEINSLRSALVTDHSFRRQPELLGRPKAQVTPVTPNEKIQLFLKLFRCRADVFPKRWENPKSAKQGYSPACANEWVKPICQKPNIRCAECTHQKFLPLNEEVVANHLKTSDTVGTYAIRGDDTCTFLACDFDEASWRDDVVAYKRAAGEFGIDVAIERSRSGKGAHAWIFFEDAVLARTARSLGTLILAKCSERNTRLSLNSFDRFFPSQDYLPKGGFGNLIAFPLQKVPREQGNSCFVDDTLGVFQDQWAYLSQVRCLSNQEVRSILDQNLPKVDLASRKDGFDDISWITDQAILEESTGERVEFSLEGATIEIGFGPMVSIPLTNMPRQVVGKLKKIACFPNPEFYKRQRMRMQTYPEPRFIFSGEMRPEEIILPRGVLDEALKILMSAGAKVVIRDERIAKKKVKVTFSGELTPEQQAAVKVWKSNDLGILCAPPGVGKTVMGCAVIAQRKVSTLILVHRHHLMDQWKKQINKFLGIPPKEIGTMSGAKKKLTGKIDIASLMSLSNIEDFSEIGQRYSQIIIDECHHVPAKSFEAILKQLPSRYILGLTATPYRKDGLEKILFHQCGPIRHEIKSVDGGILDKSVRVFETGFKPPDEVGQRPPYHVLLHYLTSDFARNYMIVDVTRRLAIEGFPLLISDRKDHLDQLQNLLKERSQVEIVRLGSEHSAKQRKLIMDQIVDLRSKSVPMVLMATGSLVGEGFDLPGLDTLILATPLSFEGRMVQYAGRLHRLVEGKTKVQIIDFVDSYNAMLLKMYRNRLNAYRKMEYIVQEPQGFFAARKSRGKGLGFLDCTQMSLSVSDQASKTSV